MVRTLFTSHLQSELEVLRKDGLYKTERVLASPQQANVCVNDAFFINLCANNYLGLANDEELIISGQKALKEHGCGMASVRFICGTQKEHVLLEDKIAHFLGKEDSILYASCFDANTGLFETLLGPEDAIISDALNHASIIDGIRLCKASRYRYENNDMQALKQQLIAAKGARFKMIATDGVFSMDGIMANLPDICELAERYNAMVMVDDSHAVGFIGENGRGTPEYHGVAPQIDILTGTLGKALGGAGGGYTAANTVIVDYLRQRSRPYLFSNSLAPVIVHNGIAAIDRLEKSKALALKLKRNSLYFREKMQQSGFTLVPGEHPIIPVMLGDAKLAAEMAERLLKEGIYVVSFSFPVVPKGQARIRTQMSAAHELADLDKAIEAFRRVGRILHIL